jgi:hypothetical protein
VDGFERDLHAVSRGQGGESRIAFIMHKDHFLDPKILKIVNDRRQPFLDDLGVGKVDVNHIAKELLAEDVRRQDVFKKLPLHHFQELGHETKGQNLFFELPHPVFSLGLAYVNPLCGDRPGCNEDAFFISSFGNEIEGMIAPFAIFLAGVTGHTLLEDKGIFILGDFYHLCLCRLFVRLQVLALDKAVTGWAGPTPIGVKG